MQRDRAPQNHHELPGLERAQPDKRGYPVRRVSAPITPRCVRRLPPHSSFRDLIEKLEMPEMVNRGFRKSGERLHFGHIKRRNLTIRTPWHVGHMCNIHGIPAPRAQVNIPAFLLWPKWPVGDLNSSREPQIPRPVPDSVFCSRCCRARQRKLGRGRM